MIVNLIAQVMVVVLIVIGFEIPAVEQSLDVESAQIKNLIDTTRTSKFVPGIIAAITDETGLRAIAASGVRKQGEKVALTVHDKVHLGSCTKAMTAALIARLVEKQKLDWHTTVESVLPTLCGKIHPSFHQVTLHELLTHRGGLPANAQDWWLRQDLPLRQRRLSVLVETLSAAPAAKKGGFLYSNLSYVLAGSMAEAKMDQTWEQLITAEVFAPLKMETAGFGPPGHKARLDQPWGHQRVSGKWEPQYVDNAEALGPAGRVHCSVADWAKFLAVFMEAGPKDFLKQKEISTLVQPVEDYAAGWFVVERAWAKGTAYNHSGSNTMWYAVVWIAPTCNRSYIVVLNSCDEASAAIADAIMGGLIQLDLQKR